jgi:nicotinate-nucleotide adenylyltransferase
VRSGILGGTFDPVHNGHLVLAGEVAARLHLDEVIFIPTGCPHFKANTVVSPAEHRLEMLQLAISRHPLFKISTMELERPGPTYTVDTITELCRRRGPEDEFYFILGWDNLKELTLWRQPEQLLSLCKLVAVPRIGGVAPDLKVLEAAIGGLKGSVVMLDSPRIDISASAIRCRVADGLSIANLVPEAIEGYIKEHGLYRKKK